MYKNRKPVFLIGFPGSGKTTLGVRLSKITGCSFADLDRCIEQREQLTVPEIFEKKGESYFRAVESEELRARSRDFDMIACGGGTPAFNDNMDFMVQTGVTVYIELPPGVLLNRLIASKQKRPLFDNLREGELRRYIEVLFAERLPHYQRAQFTLSGIDLKNKDLTETIKLLFG